MATLAETLSPPPRRAQILNAALDLFARHGMNNVTTRQIAAAVGISQPSLYAHFPSREAICAAVCIEAMERLTASLRAAAAIEGPFAVRARALARAYLDFALNNHSAYRVAFMGEFSSDGFHADAEVLGAGLAAFYVLLALVNEVHGRDAHRAALVAQSAWAAIHGLASLLMCCVEFPWVDREAFITMHIEGIVERIVKPA